MSYSIDSVSEKLLTKLKEYLETQYPITNREIQEKRNKLLNTKNLLSNEPYIESTPVYEAGSAYENMDIPNDSKYIMKELSNMDPSVGVYSTPYNHQQKAMEEFLTYNKDLVISTGTGSGKTESFLHPMLNKLYDEAVNRPQSFSENRAVRALILYPMNALVNDQMSRLRLLYGDNRVKEVFKEKGTRPVKFGMYTSRTPYPGVHSYGKDRNQLDPLLKYYLKIEEENPELAEEMKQRGRWISKDIKKFKKSKVMKTKDTYKTCPNDAELFTRHEMQENPPDILVTNYSMLEYMMMRPIERSIWDDTKEWLAKDKNNEFILILDEAHMYRGASGAEVALLIRRLQSRLEIPRDRMRCILTSASMAKKGDSNTAIKFAEDLTGKPEKRTFQLIEGITEIRGNKGTLSERDMELLSKINIDTFRNYFTNYDLFFRENEEVITNLGWEHLPIVPEELNKYLFNQLDGYPPLEKIISLISGQAHTLKEIINEVSPYASYDIAKEAISNLIILANAAKKNKRVLLPARLHMFFRGITGVFICLNKDCSGNHGEEMSYGKIYDTPRIQCECGSRVYEVLTHNLCGSSFIRLFINSKSDYPKFTWNEKGKGIVDEELKEVHIYIEDRIPHSKILEQNKIKPVWLDTKTGYLFDEPHKERQLLKVYISNEEHSKRKKWFNRSDLITFEHCPSCAKDSKGNIRDLKTKGEPPFANLVREQFVLQPPVKGKENLQNGGRKVLIFSDGRQKAARLARDIPREVEKDVLRQIIIKLSSLIKNTRMSDYYQFILLFMELSNISLLEGKDKEDLEAHKKNLYKLLREDLSDLTRRIFEEPNNEELKDLIHVLKDLKEDNYADEEMEKGIETLFYQVLISPGYSLYDLCVGYLAPRKGNLNRMHDKVKDVISKEELYNLSILFIKEMQDNIAFNSQLNPNQREDIMGLYRPDWGVDNNNKNLFFKNVLELYPESVRAKLRKTLFDLCQFTEGKHFINHNMIIIKNGLEDDWYNCNQCRTWHPFIILNQCPTCFSNDIQKHSSDSSVLLSEKGYWRKPVHDVLQGKDIFNYNVEEHSAQLSQKDVGTALATTEKYELGFQDIKVEDQEIVDILSCTTTMEVGIDVGSLTAVAMRNIPPFRENYQQRAGRAGRRSTNLSTVITYAQDSPHDHYYFENADKMISGNTREVKIYIDNKKILTRHIHALLIQTYSQISLQSQESNLFYSLGKTNVFFEAEDKFSIDEFELWLIKNKGNKFKDLPSIFKIIPSEVLETERTNALTIVIEIADKLIEDLRYSYDEITDELKAYLTMKEEEIDQDIPYYQNQDFLTFLFNNGFLPTYAFPRDLSSFYIQRKSRKGIEISQRPQLELNQALSQYAPGKLIVVDKEAYRVGGIYNPHSRNGENSVQDLFNAQEYVSICPKCYFTQLNSLVSNCPNCSSKLYKQQYIRPFGFSPEKGISLRRNEVVQEYSYASAPQLPIPNEEELFSFKSLNENQIVRYDHVSDKELIVLNRGSYKDSGFLMCNECGYIVGNDENITRSGFHMKPYLTYNSDKCYGSLQEVFLGNKFSTDLLLVRMKLTEGIYFESNMEWLHDALETIGEAFVISASRVLEIDINELGVGYRLFRKDEENFYADMYIYDKLSGGAGYSSFAGLKIESIFKEMFEVLSNCVGNCDQSCYKCLRYFENQYKHTKLDRHLGLDLLNYLIENKMTDYPEEYVTGLLKQIQNVNDLLGVKSYLNVKKRQIEIESTRQIVKVRNNISLEANKDIIYFSPYEIKNDLPNVYERIKDREKLKVYQ